MEKLISICILLVVLFSFKETLTAQVLKDIQIIPKPLEMSVLSGTYEMNEHTSIKADKALLEKVEQLISCISMASGFSLPINKQKSEENLIELKIMDELASLGEEGYKINVTSKKVLISAYKPTGIFYGIQTLRQLFPNDILRKAVVENVKWTIPCVNIVDKPRFKWRGLMIDYSRTFWNKSLTQKYIDALAYYKMNKLHMHLTDDQGWRIAIDKYPALTKKGSKFDTIYHEPAEREGYFTKDDIREIIKYAEARNVEIIPEIEMPGHSLAVLATYPELSCTGNKFAIHPFFKGPMIHDEILCVGKEKTFEFLENVLSEVMELFPSQYVHIGGDEAPKANWKACPDCQRVKTQNGLKDEDELQSWFIRRMEKYINSNGKKMIGWDEICEGGLSKTATVMFWRGDRVDVPLAAINQGNDVIMSPTTHCYFDYPYDKITYWGEFAIHPTSIEKVYSYEPISGKLENVDSQRILGVQANFWSHVARSEPDMDRQIFPRLLALSEVAWSETRNRNWNDFSVRLKNHAKLLDLLNMYHFDLLEVF